MPPVSNALSLFFAKGPWAPNFMRVATARDAAFIHETGYSLRLAWFMALFPTHCCAHPLRNTQLQLVTLLRCLNGYECEFCHYEHEKRKRKNKKNKKKKTEAGCRTTSSGLIRWTGSNRKSQTDAFRYKQAGDQMDDFFAEGTLFGP